jgi:hypothetical protein
MWPASATRQTDMRRLPMLTAEERRERRKRRVHELLQALSPDARRLWLQKGYGVRRLTLTRETAVKKEGAA